MKNHNGVHFTAMPTDWASLR